MTNLADITAALVAALAVRLGSFDLTGTDSVKVGTFGEPPTSAPFVGIAPGQVSRVPFDLRQRKWTNTATFVIRLWVPSTREDLPQRSAAAIEAAVYGLRALEAARTADRRLLLCSSFVPKLAGLDQASARSPQSFATARLTIEAVYVTEQGI